MTLYTDVRRRLCQASGDAKYSLDQEECTAFILSTNKRAAVTVREREGGREGGRESVCDCSMKV